MPLDRRTRALVYTLHNPFAPVSLLLGIVKGGDSDTLRRMLLDLADRFALGDHVLLRGLPHWVKTTPVDSVQISEQEGAVIFERLHTGALSRGVAHDPDVAEQVRLLELLREDPLSEINRQFVRALKQPRNPERGAGPDADDYLTWYRTASSSEHVRALTSCFMPCWNTALRLQPIPSLIPDPYDVRSSTCFAKSLACSRSHASLMGGTTMRREACVRLTRSTVAASMAFHGSNTNHRHSRWSSNDCPLTHGRAKA